MSTLRAINDVASMRRLAAGRSAIISVVDIGSTKICCMIAKLRPQPGGAVLEGRSHAVEVLGFGHQRAQGIKSGVVTGMAEAERSLRLAVDSAERSAGLTVDSLIVSVSAGRLSSDAFSSSVRLGDAEVEEDDVAAALGAGFEHCQRDDRMVLHALPIGYGLDGTRGIDSPLGMSGQELSVDMHMVSAERAPLSNLENCVNRAHLSVEAMVAAPYASGLATMVADEARMGCACIDMGGGTTTVSIFLGGHLVFVDAIAVGGNHVTTDIARMFSARMADAERIKVLHGNALGGQGAARDFADLPRIGDNDEPVPQQIALCDLDRIIAPRIEETFELVRDRIARSGFGGSLGNRLIITGGASQLSGVADVASRILGAKARLGRPMGLSGLPNTAKGPAFAAAAGLLIYPQIAGHEFTEHVSPGLFAHAGGGRIARMGRWLKQAF